MLWGAGWLRRVELQTIAAPCVRALGLAYRPEAWAAEVRAGGTLDGRPVEVRWRSTLAGTVLVRARLGDTASWVDLPSDQVEAGLRALTTPV